MPRQMTVLPRSAYPSKLGIWEMNLGAKDAAKMIVLTLPDSFLTPNTPLVELLAASPQHHPHRHLHWSFYSRGPYLTPKPIMHAIDAFTPLGCTM